MKGIRKMMADLLAILREDRIVPEGWAPIWCDDARLVMDEGDKETPDAQLVIAKHAAMRRDDPFGAFAALILRGPKSEYADEVLHMDAAENLARHLKAKNHPFIKIALPKVEHRLSVAAREVLFPNGEMVRRVVSEDAKDVGQ